MLFCSLLALSTVYYNDYGTCDCAGHVPHAGGETGVSSLLASTGLASSNLGGARSMLASAQRGAGGIFSSIMANKDSPQQQ